MEEILVEGEWGSLSKYSLHSLAVDEIDVRVLNSGNDERFLEEFKKNVNDLAVSELKPDISKFTDEQLIRIIKAFKIYSNALDSISHTMDIKYEGKFYGASDRRRNEENEEEGDEEMLSEFDNLVRKAQRQINKRFSLEIVHDGLAIWISKIYEETN